MELLERLVGIALLAGMLVSTLILATTR